MMAKDETLLGRHDSGLLLPAVGFRSAHVARADNLGPVHFAECSRVVRSKSPDTLTQVASAINLRGDVREEVLLSVSEVGK